MDDHEELKLPLRARVINTDCFCVCTSDTTNVGDVVLLTRDHRHLDGTVATDIPGTWGAIGEHYEIIDEEPET